MGEPLVKYRFPLDKLALLESATNGNTANADQIARYFGLDIAPLPGPYRHFNYPTTNTAYAHSQGSGANGIMSLNDVAALSTTYGKPGREPDFFELLQASILQGSLGVHNFVTSKQNLYARSDFVWQENQSSVVPKYLIGGKSMNDPDTSVTYQLLRIGANIIDQWHADNYPTTITGSFVAPHTVSPVVSTDVYGICDLPYISALFMLPYNQSANMGTGSAYGPTIYICPQVWNPHQPSGAVSSPTSFLIAPDSNHGSGNTGDAWEITLLAPGNAPTGSGSGGPWSGAIWKYNLTTQTYGAAMVAANFAATNVIAFSAGASDYREPSVITNAVSANNASGLWAPTSPTVGAIQLPIPLPSSSLLASTAPVPGTHGVMTAASIANALPVNSPANTTNLSWVQATNAANYGAATFNLPAGTPCYQIGTFGWNGVFMLEYLNPIDGNYYPYGTFEGLANNTNQETGFSTTLGPSIETNAAAPLNYAQVWVKSDPRTFRLGPGQKSSTGINNATGSDNPYSSLNPTNTAALATLANTIDNEEPFYGIGGTLYLLPPTTLPSPSYRLDLWAVNDSIVAGPTSPTVDSRYTYPDPDGITRYGDAHYAYNSAAGYATPFLTGAANNRPVILHRPFRSVGELGYVFRDDPWRTLDFYSPVSADAGLLDLFTMSDGQVVSEHNGQKTTVVAGRVNPNTPYPQVLAAMMVGGTQNIAGSTSLTTNAAWAWPAILSALQSASRL